MATTGHTYNGVSSGSASGTIGASNIAVQLSFSTKTIAVTFYRNTSTSDTTTIPESFAARASKPVPTTGRIVINRGTA